MHGIIVGVCLYPLLCSLYSGLTEAFTTCLEHLLIALGQQPLAQQMVGETTAALHSGAVLICGSGTGSGIGCGKTSLAHALCHQLQQWPTCAHVTIVDCIPFRGVCVCVCVCVCV